MATHSSILAWKIPWMEEPGRLRSVGLQRVRCDWVTSLFFFLEFFTSWAHRAVQLFWVLPALWVSATHWLLMIQGIQGVIILCLPSFPNLIMSSLREILYVYVSLKCLDSATLKAGAQYTACNALVSHLWQQCFSKCGSYILALSDFGCFLNTLSPGPLLRPIEFTSLDWGPGICMVNKPPQGIFLFIKIWDSFYCKFSREKMQYIYIYIYIHCLVAVHMCIFSLCKT